MNSKQQSIVHALLDREKGDGIPLDFRVKYQCLRCRRKVYQMPSVLYDRLTQTSVRICQTCAKRLKRGQS